MSRPPADVSPEVEALAVDFVQRREAGEAPDLEACAARLADEAERAAFRRLVGGVAAVQALLPTQVGPGTVLGRRYAIVRQIGAGGMGKVFLAEDRQLQRPVAIKVLAAMATDVLDSEALFVKESRLLATLQHPNIVAVHESSRQGDVRYLVMDLVEGRSMAEVIAAARARLEVRGRAHPREGALLDEAIGHAVPEGLSTLVDSSSWSRSAARVMVEVCRTLEAAHGKGVLHRDLKPGNVLLRGGAHPVLLDFGLAGHMDQRAGSITRGLFGSVAYLAPEQARSTRVGADPRTDVYQLGVVLYELLTLRRAFEGDGATQTLQRISQGRFTAPRAIDRAIPRELEDVMLRAMEVRPEQRYESARAMREDLERWLAGIEPPRAARGGPLARGVRGLRYAWRRHRLASATAAALLLGLVAGALHVSEPRAALDVQPYRFDPRTDASVDIWSGDTVSADDIVGVRVASDRPRYAYALSVFGDRDPPTWVAPMPVELVTVAEPGGEPRDPEPVEYPDAWGVRVPPGRAWINCTQIEGTADEVPFEGLWVFTSDEPQPDLVAWMDRLERMRTGQGPGAPGVPFAAAWDALQRPPDLVRGASPRQSEAERRGQLRAITREALRDDDDWPLEDPERHVFFFRVAEP